MSHASAARVIPAAQVDQLREAKEILRQEAAAIQEISQQLDTDFCRAVDIVFRCAGKIAVTGMGKAGLIGRKLTATLSSTGTSAFFLHPAEAVHGDLGGLQMQDVVLALSNSGETEEISRILPSIRRHAIPIVAITANRRSTLGSQADVVLGLGRLREAGANGLAPSTSTTAMLALGDALALVVSRMKDFTPQQFAALHPAGSLGRKLTRVSDVMRSGAELRIAPEDATIRDVLTTLRVAGRRTGAIMLVDEEERLTGLFTDSDLARLLEQRRDGQLDRPVREVMTQGPITVGSHATLEDAVTVLSERKLSELPVVDAERRPVGLIDITDVIGLLPQETPS